MMVRLRTMLGLMLLMMIVLGIVAIPGGSVSADHVTPVLVDGNPNCTDLGYAYGVRIDPPTPGTYPVGNGTVTFTSDGTYVDWTSTIGIDAVIVKGGPNANVYVYDPPSEAFGDTGLHSPNNQSGGPAGLSHIDFCFDYEVIVTKSATTTFTRTFNWTIDKSVTPATWNLFDGDTGTSEYTVTVTKTGYTDSAWAVNGTISINNPAPDSATITGVSDDVSGVAAPVDCGVSFPYELAAGETLNCTYTVGLPDGTNRTNTATVTTSGAVGGGTGTADVTFGSPTSVVNSTVNVTDSVQGSLGSFSDSGSTTYTRTFTCDEDEGTHNNTATIIETEQSDSASVTVNCYALTVTKDADTNHTRDWTWDIEKSADQTSLNLTQGEQATVNYTVSVSASDTNNYSVSGNISVSNPAPIAATINSVSDVISPSTAATVTCNVAFPYTLAATSSLPCTYSATLPDGTSQTNTATATRQAYSYDEDLNPSPNGTVDYTGSAAVSFSGTPDVETNECVDVTDTNVGFLGTVCASDADKTLEYSLTFGTDPASDVDLVCGNNSHPNTATATPNDGGAPDSDDETVTANVTCEEGCTLTQGYWKTHSARGPAPFDDTWNELPNAENTIFFLSGQSYYTVLNTVPAGNAYYILAHQYIAAQLNQLAGASIPSDVLASFNAATNLLNTYTPAQIRVLRGNNAVRVQFLALATTLDSYNNGLLGPGHCQ